MNTMRSFGKYVLGSALTAGLIALGTASANARDAACGQLEDEFIALSTQIDNGEAARSGYYPRYVERLREVENALIDLNCGSSAQQPVQPVQPLGSESNILSAPQDLPPLTGDNELFQNTSPDIFGTPAPNNELFVEPSARNETTYRTMCVRSCDGFYFPISESITERGLIEDEQICRSMCPTQDVELYVYRNPGESIEQMRTLDGIPYSVLPTANQFRTNQSEACSCTAEPAQNASQPNSVLNSQDLENLPSLSQPVSPEQNAGQQGSSPKRVFLNPQTGEFSQQQAVAQQPQLAPIAEPETKKVAPQKRPEPREVPAKTGPIRKVGPKFFPGQ